MTAFAAWAHGRKELRMELFYREMRKRTGLLMDADGKPEGGRLELRQGEPQGDAEAADPAAAPLRAAEPGDHAGDRRRCEAVPDAISDRSRPSAMPRRPTTAETVVADFIANLLPGFGDYQDAMVRGEPWMWHSIISAAMNMGLIDPLDVCPPAPRPNIVPGARRSMPWRVSSGRSSAGANTCAGSTG